MGILATTMIYLTNFFAVLCLSEIVDKKFTDTYKYKMVRIFLYCLLVCMPCLLAAFRGDTVGTDLLVYLLPDFYEVQQCDSLVQSFEILNYKKEEFGYIILVYLCTLLSDTPGLLQFFVQFLVFVPVVLSVWKLRFDLNLPVSFGTFLFMYYNFSFNIMRQSIAASFLLLGVTYMYEKRYAKFLICACIAISFHKFSILGILMILAVTGFMRFFTGTVLSYFKLTGLVICVFSFSESIYSLINSNFELPYRLVYYANTMFYRNTGTTYFILENMGMGLYSEVVLRSILVLVSIYFLRYYKETKLLRFIKVSSFIGILVYTLILIFFETRYGYRISHFFDCFNILLFGYAVQRPYKKVKKALFLILLFFYWVGTYMIMNYHTTNIFVFS